MSSLVLSRWIRVASQIPADYSNKKIGLASTSDFIHSNLQHAAHKLPQKWCPGLSTEKTSNQHSVQFLNVSWGSPVLPKLLQWKKKFRKREARSVVIKKIQVTITEMICSVMRLKASFSFQSEMHCTSAPPESSFIGINKYHTARGYCTNIGKQSLRTMELCACVIKALSLKSTSFTMWSHHYIRVEMKPPHLLYWLQTALWLFL